MGDSFDKFKEYSVAEFFKKNRQMLGFSGKIRSLTTLVHEYVTNSLDGCEEHKVLPEINIEIKELENKNIELSVQDNGVGIPEKLIGKALAQMLAGTKFARYVQQRGQQGIGAAGCTMYALLTSGKPIYVESRYKKICTKCTVSIDFKSNTPILSNVIKEEGAENSGLFIKGEFGDVKYDSGAYGVYEYLKRTAIANPHAQIKLIEPNGNSVLFPRSDERIPEKPKEILPHPLGISTHDLWEFAKKENQNLSVFLQTSFSRVSLNKVRELKENLPPELFNKKTKELSWEDCDLIVKAFGKVKWIAPAMDSLIPIGPHQIEKAMKNILMPEFISVTKRSPKVFKGGIPFLVEAAIGYGGNAGRIKKTGEREGDLLRFANRVPLLFDGGSCAITESIKNMDWPRYGIKNFEQAPITVFVNFISVHVPYLGAGKQAISQEEEILDEIKNAVQEAARNIQRYISSVVRERESKHKKNVILRYVKQLSQDLSELTDKKQKQELEKLLIEIVEKKYDKNTEGE